MSDFELLKSLQKELIDTLERRREAKHIDRSMSKARIHMLRLLIDDVTKRIESQCESPISAIELKYNETWY